MCNSTDFRPKEVSKKKKKKKIWGHTYHTIFFGSLEVPEDQKNRKHALLIRCQTFLPTKLISNILCDFFPSL